MSRSEHDAALANRTIAILDAARAMDLGAGGVQVSLLPHEDEYDVIAYACALWTSAYGGCWSSRHGDNGVSTVSYSIGYREIVTLHIPKAIMIKQDQARTEIDRAQMWNPSDKEH